MYAQTKCSHCHFVCRNLQVGDTCIACGLGAMQRLSEGEQERLTLNKLESAMLRNWINEQHMS